MFCFQRLHFLLYGESHFNVMSVLMFVLQTSVLFRHFHLQGFGERTITWCLSTTGISVLQNIFSITSGSPTALYCLPFHGSFVLFLLFRTSITPGFYFILFCCLILYHKISDTFSLWFITC